MPRKRIQRAGSILGEDGIIFSQKSSALKLVFDLNHRRNQAVLKNMAKKHGVNPPSHIETLRKALGSEFDVRRKKAFIEIRPKGKA